MGCAVSVMCGVVQIGCLCQWWCRTGWTCRDCRLDLASWASVILWKQWGDSTRHFFISTGLVRGTVRRDLEFWRRLRSAGGQGPLGSFDWRGAWAPRFFQFPELIRQSTVRRTLEVHELMLCCYYSAKHNPCTDWSDLSFMKSKNLSVAKGIFLQHLSPP